MSAATALIQRLRSRGLSQTEIAQRTNIPQPRLSRWEAGYAPRGADDALRLLELEQQLGGPLPNEVAVQTVAANSEGLAHG